MNETVQKATEPTPTRTNDPARTTAEILAVATHEFADKGLTGARIDATTALEWGLVNRVIPDAELMQEAEKLARTLAAGPTRSFGSVKKLRKRGRTRTEARAEATP